MLPKTRITSVRSGSESSSVEEEEDWEHRRRSRSCSSSARRNRVHPGPPPQPSEYAWLAGGGGGSAGYRGRPMGADTIFSSREVVRRSLQPPVRRERINSLGNTNFRRTCIISERRHSVGGRDGILYNGPAQPVISSSIPNLVDCKMPRLKASLPPLLPLGDSSPPENQPVILLRSAFKGYGRGSKHKTVLNHLNLTVTRGQIYGLLGASGCGKTTLLSIVVGRKKLDSGVLSVCGGLPGDGICGIPGPKVGYMPQELALYEEFTVRETADYFGRIYKMSAKQVRAQLDFLMNLLELPTDNRCIGTFSGGQQRRVSFLVSLLPDPDLLILDEPTVGLDPLLRENIWKHLVHLATVRQKTILITTHYIEEAKQAGHVGMMRGGRLLAEDSPASLLEQYNLDSLEDVFLRLCVSDTEKDGSPSHDQSRITGFPPPVLILPATNIYARLKSAQFPGLRKGPKNNHEISRFSAESGFSTAFSDKSLQPHYGPDDTRYSTQSCSSSPTRYSTRCCSSLPSPNNFLALLIKNFLKLKRNPVMLSFVFLLPAIQVVFFCVAIGREPSSLRLGVVNEESSCSIISDGCVFENLSCRILEVFKSSQYFISYDNTSTAFDAVKSGDIWGLVHFPANFSANYISRMTSPVDATEQILDGSNIKATLDMSNQQIALTIQNHILTSFNNFTRQILRDCKYPEEAASLPITWEPPVYGSQDPSFTEFMAPGIIILIIYFLAVALTGESFISERSSGLLDRSWVAGVQPSEILASHIVAQFVVMLVQTFVTLATIIWGFNIACLGPVHWLAILTILQGLAGMCFGFLISALCDTQAVAMQLSIGSFYPNLLLSGILWPLEGMPQALRTIARLLPNTLACTAMRNIMLRGWDIDHQEVWLGVVSSSVWIVIFFTLSWITIRIRS